MLRNKVYSNKRLVQDEIVGHYKHDRSEPSKRGLSKAKKLWLQTIKQLLHTIKYNDLCTNNFYHLDYDWSFQVAVH